MSTYEEREQALNLLGVASAHGLLTAAEIQDRTREILEGERVTTVTLTPNITDWAGQPVKLAEQKLVGKAMTEEAERIKAGLDEEFEPDERVKLVQSDEVDIAEFLRSKGVPDNRLWQLVGPFTSEVAKLYVEAHDDYPSKDENGLLYIFHASDAPLIEETYRRRFYALELQVFGSVEL